MRHRESTILVPGGTRADPPIESVERRRLGSRVASAVRVKLLGIGPEEAEFARRGFPEADPVKQQWLERAGKTFVSGYRVALASDPGPVLDAALEQHERDVRGFAYEGAAMGLALRDAISPLHHSRFRRFVDDHDEHVYMIHVGMGWALARLRRDVRRPLTRLDPLLGWLAVDGVGFHTGYFEPNRFFATTQPAAPTPIGYAARVFDQGLGRSLWFFAGADVERVAAHVRAFPPGRRDDLWSGIGLAATYAGGCSRDELSRLQDLAGASVGHLAQGAVFAAGARRRARNVVAPNEVACSVLAGMTVDEAAELAESSVPSVVAAVPGEPIYETWRARIRSRFASAAR
ncbi:MAG TPA: DUF1702 family protein [Acidimicrobiia bacterium]|jgi:hypothetical protein